MLYKICCSSVVDDWCEINRIRVNKKKTKHMILGSDRKTCALDGTLLDKEIGLVKTFTYLGVNIDDKLNFEKFISGTISRVNLRLITLARIRKTVDVKTALLIYKQTILPILDYMCIVVNASTQAKIKKLQPLQNRAIRTVEKRTGYISTEAMNDLHVKLKLALLTDRRKRFMLKLVYKLSHDMENRPEMALRTAPKVKMKLDFTDKERVRRNPYYLCNRLWDELDSETQLSENMFEFTKKLCKNK